MSIFKKIRNKIQDSVGEGSGTAGEEEQAGMRDPRPYKSYFSNGMFYGQDGKLRLYFKFPDDVAVEWTKTYRDSADNQSFLTTIIDTLGKSIINSSESTRKDERIKFHIPMGLEMTDELQGYYDATPANADFIKRMGGFPNPVWHAYLGVELTIGDINSDVYKTTDKIRHYIDFMTGNADIEYELYKDSIDLVTSVCLDKGMIPLDFSSRPEDFQRLTAWFASSDFQYGMQKELTNEVLKVPEHGKSIFTGLGEISLSAITPKESRDMFIKDPFDSVDTRFGTTLLDPRLNVVHINIRGEIRSPETAGNIFDNKLTRSEHKSGNTSVENSSASDRSRYASRAQRAEIAVSQAINMESAWLDNVEMTVATIVTGRKSTLPQAMEKHGMDVRNITGRQHIALMSSIPCYPNPIFRIPSGDASRNPNVNNFYSGVLSLSGLFRATKPAASRGILLGLSDSGYEYREIYTEVEAPGKYGSKPVIYISGSSGSGKTVQILMMLAQTVYAGQQVVMLNPKPESSLKPFFDYLGGTTINMSYEYLSENPGLLDPMFYIEDRERVGQLLADMIINAQGLESGSSNTTEKIRSSTHLRREIIERAKHPSNQCSYDVIFGNKRVSPPTTRLPDDDTVEFVRTKMDSSAFWKASISMDPSAQSSFRDSMNTGRPILVEWDNSITLPSSEESPDNWSQPVRDGIQSVVNLFNFSAEIIGSSRQGGILAIDEAYVLKTSEVAMGLVKYAGKTWRNSNITLLLATQELKEFLGKNNKHNIGSSVRAYIIMQVEEEDTEELDIFFDLTGLPRDESNIYYISHAGMKPAGKAKKSIPNAYLIDKTYDWEGGIICGPWPERELKLASKNGKVGTRESMLGNIRESSMNHLPDADMEDIMGENDIL